MCLFLTELNLIVLRGPCAMDRALIQLLLNYALPGYQLLSGWTVGVKTLDAAVCVSDEERSDDRLV